MSHDESRAEGEVEIATGVVFMDGDVAHWIAKPGTKVSFENAQELVEAVRTVSGGRPVGLIADIREVRYAARAAREYGSSPVALEVMTALALVVESGISRVIGNFYVGINKPPVPSRLFTTSEEAAEWLATLAT